MSVRAFCCIWGFLFSQPAYLDALKAAPKVVKEFIDGIFEKFKKQEKDIMYDPIPADKPFPQKKPKSKDYER